MSQLLTQEQMPQQVSELLLGLSSNPLLILLIISLTLLAVGVFMDMTPAVLIFYTDFPAYCDVAWHRPSPLQIIMIKPLHRLAHTACRDLSFVGAGWGTATSCAYPEQCYRSES